VRTDQLCALSLNTVEIGSLQSSAGQISVLQVGAAQESLAQVGVGQVQPTRPTPRPFAAAEHRQGSLNVGCPLRQGRGGFQRLVGGRLLIASGWPGCMPANEGAEHLGNLCLVLGRVIGDSLQRVDAPQAHVDLVLAGLAELVDRLGVAVGDLAFAGDLKLPISEVGTKQQHPAGQGLQ
jgi:hypothetical protein